VHTGVVQARTAVDGIGSQEASADTDAFDLSLVSDRWDGRLRKLFSDGDYCMRLADSTSNPQARRMLTAVGEALWALADEGRYGVAEDYRIEPVLVAFFEAAQRGSVPTSLVRQLARAIRGCAQAVRLVDAHAVQQREANRCAQRKLRHAYRILKQAIALDDRKKKLPPTGLSLSSLIQALTLAPSAPPASRF
jgi:hypothetical protein